LAQASRIIRLISSSTGGRMRMNRYNLSPTGEREEPMTQRSELGVMRPRDSSNNRLLVSFLPLHLHLPYAVGLNTLPSTYANCQWDVVTADPVPGPVFAIVSRYTQTGEIALTMNADAPGQPIYATTVQTDPATGTFIREQQWTLHGPYDFFGEPPGQAWFVSPNGNILQAEYPDRISNLTLGRYQTPANPFERPPRGQAFLVSSS
jgi:hypothetical protein